MRSALPMFDREAVTRGTENASYPDVGLYLDNDRAIAAVSHPVSAGPSLHLASLHPAILYMHGDDSISLGAHDDPHARQFVDFVDRVGEDVQSVPAEHLVAMSLLCLLTEVASSIGLEPTALAAAATYPAQWTADQVFAVRSSMNGHGLAHVALVSEAEAAAAWSATTQATWQVSDPAIAAARGAAELAAEFPVDAITEEFPVLAPVRSPRAGRRPLVLAVAFAAVLVLGACGVAIALRANSGSTEIPTIDSVQAESSTTARSTVPSLPIAFPTVVPGVDAVAVTTVPTTTTESSSPTQADEPTTRDRTPVTTRAELETRPVAEVPEDTTPVTVDPVTTSPSESTTTPTSSEVTDEPEVPVPSEAP